MTTTTDVRFKDFSKKHTPVFFRIDEQDFEALPTLSIPVMQDLIGRAGSLQEKNITPEIVGEILQIFTVILKPQSAQQFVARVNDTENPVDLTQVMDILTWLMEIYGRRPTTPSPDSSDGLPTGTGGTDSTDGVSASA